MSQQFIVDIQQGRLFIWVPEDSCLYYHVRHWERGMDVTLDDGRRAHCVPADQWDGRGLINELQRVLRLE